MTLVCSLGIRSGFKHKYRLQHSMSFAISYLVVWEYPKCKSTAPASICLFLFVCAESGRAVLIMVCVCQCVCVCVCLFITCKARMRVKLLIFVSNLKWPHTVTISIVELQHHRCYAFYMKWFSLFSEICSLHFYKKKKSSKKYFT